MVSHYGRVAGTAQFDVVRFLTQGKTVVIETEFPPGIIVKKTALGAIQPFDLRGGGGYFEKEVLLDTGIDEKHGKVRISLDGICYTDMVNAPLIEECFINLECKFRWEREITEGDDHVLLCLEVVNVHVDERHIDENDLGRTGKTGILYNIHHPINPENYDGSGTTIWVV